MDRHHYLVMPEGDFWLLCEKSRREICASASKEGALAAGRQLMQHVQTGEVILDRQDGTIEVEWDSLLLRPEQ